LALKKKRAHFIRFFKVLRNISSHLDAFYQLQNGEARENSHEVSLPASDSLLLLPLCAHSKVAQSDSVMCRLI